MNNRRIWFRLGGVLAAAAVCTGGAAVVSDRAQEAKNVQRAFLGAMETQIQIGCYPSETGSPADLTERERTELQTAYTSRVVQAQTVVWDKWISGNPEQGFSVELPVNRDTITATMKKENGVWKLDSIDSQISLLAAVPANDEICRERYPTFQMARQAADSINDQSYIKEARFS